MSGINAPRLAPRLTPEEEKYWQAILPEGSRRLWQKHDLLYGIGSRSNGLHYCVSGGYTAIAYGAGGLQKCLWLMGSNSILGEITMLTDSAAIFSMECQEAGETVFFEKSQFEALVLRHPEVGLSLMRILAQKLYLQSADVVACTFISAKSRVAIFLLQIYRKTGNPILFTHNQLADYLGLHRVTVTNALAALKEYGLVQSTQREIIITDAASLEKFIKEK